MVQRENIGIIKPGNPKVGTSSTACPSQMPWRMLTASKCVRRSLTVTFISLHALQWLMNPLSVDLDCLLYRKCSKISEWWDYR